MCRINLALFKLHVLFVGKQRGALNKKLMIFIPKRETGTEREKKRILFLKKTSCHAATVKEILRHTNATPIGRSHVVGFCCCYCKERFPIPALLKEHTLTTHSDTTEAVFMKKSLKEFAVKLDITSLRCKICGNKLESIMESVDHLKEIHKKNTSPDYIRHVIPFKFDTDKYQCCMCSAEFAKFQTLQMHMHTSHFKNFECAVCSAGFINERQLGYHMKNHAIGEFRCKHCPKVYDTETKRKSHERSHFDANCHKCPYCGQGFVNNRYKWKHISESHDVPLPTYKCKACDRTFTESTLYYIHLKRDHLMDRPHDCEQCDKKFFTKFALRKHMLSHTGERAFQCKVCFKAFGRRSTLTEHLRIHNNDRRFKCERCGQAFVQKCSWRGHMRNKHGVDVQ